MGEIISTEARVRALEILLASAVKRLPTEDQQLIFADAFTQAMAEPSAMVLCVGMRRLSLAAEEEKVTSNGDRSECQNCRKDNQ